MPSQGQGSTSQPFSGSQISLEQVILWLFKVELYEFFLLFAIACGIAQVSSIVLYSHSPWPWAEAMFNPMFGLS